MGVEVSKLSSVVGGPRGCPTGSYPGNCSPGVEYPNLCRDEMEASAWTLLHQCTLDRWKDGHANAAGFMESRLTCDGVVHKDCSRSFCMSRQGIINISRSSFFSFRKRSKFAHMAEHFEYNHIPAQMSSINHFRVCGVLCFDESLVVLHLSCNVTCQFGLLDLRANKFLGVFGKQSTDVPNESISGALSPDKSKCLIVMPLIGESDIAPAQRRMILRLYDLRTATLLSESIIEGEKCHFAFDPRFSWRRAVVTNFERGSVNSLSIVSTEEWTSHYTNRHATDEIRGGRGDAATSALYPFLRDLQYTPGGSLIVGTMLDNVCYCREKRTMSAGPGGTGNYRPVAASVYVFDGETADTLHCIQYRRYTCALHSCPVNYRPLWSACGSRMAVVMDASSNSSTQNYVQVYKLPASPTVGLSSLQALCRVAILKSQCRHYVNSLPLPTRIIKFLQFKPEYES